MNVGSKLPRNFFICAASSRSGSTVTYTTCTSRGVRAELLARAGQRRQRDRADLAAVAEAEGQQHHLAAKTRERERLAVGAVQR